MKLKKGDMVLIISGKDRNKKGKILKTFSARRNGYSSKILVEGINLRKKHQRPRRGGEKGQIITLPAPIDISNVKLICSKCGKPTRVGFKIVEGKKFRICKKCGQEI